MPSRVVVASVTWKAWPLQEEEEQTGARVGDFGAVRCAETPDETVLLVTHGGPSSIAVEHLTHGAPTPH